MTATAVIRNIPPPPLGSAPAPNHSIRDPYLPASKRLYCPSPHSGHPAPAFPHIQSAFLRFLPRLVTSSPPIPPVPNNAVLTRQSCVHWPCLPPSFAHSPGGSWRNIGPHSGVKTMVPAHSGSDPCTQSSSPSDKNRHQSSGGGPAGAEGRGDPYPMSMPMSMTPCSIKSTHPCSLLCQSRIAS